MAVAWCTLPCSAIDGRVHGWCAASAVFHDSPRILLAAVKFFLGQDEIAEGGGDSDDEGENGEKEARAVNPTKAEVYNASKKVRACRGLPAAVAGGLQCRECCGACHESL